MSPFRLRPLLGLLLTLCPIARCAPHAALGAAVETNVSPSPRYPGKAGLATLVDGVVAEASYASGVVVGFEGIDAEITIRLDEPIQVHTIAADFLQITQPAIYLPVSVDFAVSGNGTNFRTVATVTPKATEQDQGPLHERFAVKGLDVKAQAVRVRMGNGGRVPPDHRAPQALRWTFVSEILVNPGDKPVSVWDAVRRYRFGGGRTSLARVEGLLRGTAGEDREATLVALHDLLTDKDATTDARLFACEMLGLHGGANAVPPLTQALDNKELGEAAALALGELRLPEAEKALLAALGTAADKAPVVGALAAFRTTTAAEALAPLLSDASLGPLAARSLASIGGPTAARALAAQLPKAKSDAQRQWLGEALLAAADGEGVPEPLRTEALEQAMACGTATARLAAAGMLLRRHDSPEALSRALQDAASERPALRTQATSLLGEWVGQHGIASLGESFANLPPSVRTSLVAHESDQGWLLARLADGDMLIRLASIRRLGERGTADAVPALAKRLAATGPEREALMGTLVELRDPTTDAALLTAAATLPPATHPALAEVFRRRTTAAAGPTVLSWVRNGSLPAREGWRVLGELADSGLLVPLADELAARPAASQLIGKAMLAAAKRGAGANAGALLAKRLAGAADAAERDVLVQTLGALGQRQALRAAAGDPDPAVRLSVARSLGECGSSADIDLLLTLADTEDPRQNVLALRAVIGILERTPATDGQTLGKWLERAGNLARRDEERALTDDAWVRAAENAWPDFPLLARRQLSRILAASAPAELQSRAQTVLEQITAFEPFLAKLAECHWQEAFNGQDLSGWQPVNGKPDSWTVANGLLLANAGGGGWLAREQEMTAYLFELEFRLAPGGNSGFFLRPTLTGNPAWEGIEIQLLDDAAPQYAGKLHADQYCASVYGMGPAQPGISRAAGEWQQLRVLCAGRHVAVWLNGRPVSYADLDKHMDKIDKIPGLGRQAGFPGLQNEHGPTQFRHLRFRDLR